MATLKSKKINVTFDVTIKESSEAEFFNYLQEEFYGLAGKMWTDRLNDIMHSTPPVMTITDKED